MVVVVAILTCEGVFLLVVVHWKAPDKALVSSAPVVGVETQVEIIMILRAPSKEK